MGLPPARTKKESPAYGTVALCTACGVGAIAVAWALVTSSIKLPQWIRFDCIVFVYLATVVLLGSVIGALARKRKADIQMFSPGIWWVGSSVNRFGSIVQVLQIAS